MPHTRSGDVRIYWEEAGSGPALLLIMGTGYTLETWHRIRLPLAKRFRVVMFDNRGVGRSDVPPPPYTIAQMTYDAVAVLDAAGVGRAHVFGAWLGGAVAEELALSHPDRVRSLLLAATCAYPHAVDPDGEVFEVLASRATMGPAEVVRATVPFIFHPSTARPVVEEDLAIRLEHYPSKDGYEGQSQAIVGYSNRDRLARLELPVLVIHGDADLLVPTGNGVDLAELIPGARYVEIAEASHNVFADKPVETVQVIVDFLGSVPADAAGPA